MQEVFEKIKRRIMNVATEACGYAPLTRVAAELELKEIIENVAEEFATDTNVGSNGWISCSERLPETNESVLCWAKSTARGGDVCFVGSCHNGFWFLQSSADTHSFPGQYVIVAWQPIEPYQPKGE